MYSSAAFHGVVAWEDSNPSEGFGFSMLLGQAVGRLYAIFFDIALLFWTTAWLLTGSFLFSLAFFLPISMCVGAGWLCIQVVLYAMLRASKFFEEQANLTLRQARSQEKAGEDETIESELSSDCKDADVKYQGEKDEEKRVKEEENPKPALVKIAKATRENRHAEMRKEIEESLESQIEVATQQRAEKLA